MELNALEIGQGIWLSVQEFLVFRLGQHRTCIVKKLIYWTAIIFGEIVAPFQPKIQQPGQQSSRTFACTSA
jgi:hypothetical protein